MSKIIPWITGLFVLILAIIIFFADRGSLPAWVTVLYNFPYGDKVGHFLLMGTLALLVNLSLSDRTIIILSRQVLLGSLAVGVIVTLEELSQNFFVTRSASLGDLGASYLGIVCFGLLAAHLRNLTSEGRSITRSNRC